MSGKQYLKNQLPVILINLLGMLVLALFLIASDNPIQTVLFILAVWSIVLVLSLLAFYFSRKKYLNKLLNMTEQLEERYLLPEIMTLFAKKFQKKKHLKFLLIRITKLN